MIVGLSGAMGSGKSTAFSILEQEYNAKLVKFAQPLYDIQEFIYNTISPVYKRPTNFQKDRKLLQWLGTEWGRQTISESLWLNLWEAKAVDLSEEKGLLVVADDVRYVNEADLVRKLGGIVIYLKSNKIHTRDVTTNGIQNHPSEVQLPDHSIDYVINNNGSIEELRQKITEIMYGF